MIITDVVDFALLLLLLLHYIAHNPRLRNSQWRNSYYVDKNDEIFL